MDITVKDPGYSQAVHTVPTSAIITKTGVSADYLSSVGDDMYVTVGFTETEVKDGYAYIQILADNDSTYDGDDSDGTVATPSKSLYKACFEMDDTNTANTDSYKMYFPHRYDHKNRSEGGQSASWTEFPLAASYLYKQAFKNTSYRAGSSGSIVVSPTVENINVRFDAAGKDADDWKFKDMFLRLAIADTKAPTLLDIGAPNNCIAKGNRVTLNLLFSEIVDAAGTVLHTTWGDLSVRQNSDSLSNIVSYSGFITADAGTQLRVTGLDGNVKDLIGNKLTGAVTRILTPTVAGYTAPPASGGVYSLSCLSDLYWFAEKVNTQSNVSAILTSDIVVPTAYVPEFTAIGGTGGYYGTFDGNGHTIRNLTDVTSSAGYLGLFTKIGRTGTVRGVRLENASV